MKVLIVSYYFPPGDCIADLRTGKFAKYLLRLGVDVHVLTARGDPRRQQLTPLDITEERVVRTRIFRTSRGHGVTADCGVQADTPVLTRLGRFIKHSLRMNNVRMPDDLIGWYPYAIKAGLALGRQEKFDFIFSSSGPVTSHLVAHRLQRDLGCRWVADYRDMWSLNHLTTLPPPLHWLDQRLERKTVSTATFLTTVSEPLASGLRGLHGKPAYVLTNGYDPEDYPVRGRNASDGLPCFVISYMGVLYARRDPGVFFEAVRRFADKKRITPDRLRIRFYGHDHSLALRKAAQFGLSDYVEVHKSVTYHESLCIQQQSTVLLLVEQMSATAEGVLTGKVFEYFGAERPVLATGHPVSALKGLLERTRAGTFCSDVETVETQLSGWWDEFTATQQVCFRGDAREISKYSRAKQADRLHELMCEATGGSVPGGQA